MDKAKANAVAQRILVTVSVVLCIMSVAIVLSVQSETSSPTYTPVRYEQPVPYQSERDRQIDQYVDSQIDARWRPMPGGNSKADAARVTKDILKARTWEELEQTIQSHTKEGR